MRSFPLFKELEAERDKVNAEFHKATKPQLIERLKEFGFMQPDPDNPTKLVLAEKATDNVYHLSINRYSVTVQFQHVRTGEVKLICDISNFAMNTHNMMNVIIKCVDYWLQYGVVYDYVSAQGFREIEELITIEWHKAVAGSKRRILQSLDWNSPFLLLT